MWLRALYAMFHCVKKFIIDLTNTDSFNVKSLIYEIVPN